MHSLYQFDTQGLIIMACQVLYETQNLSLDYWAVPAPMNLITRLQAKILQQPIDRECGTLDYRHNEINADH